MQDNNQQNIPTQIISQDNPHALQDAIRILRAGGLIAFPTDTIYGVATLINNEPGIQRLFEAKERSPSKAIAVLIGEINQLSLVAQLRPSSMAAAETNQSQLQTIQAALSLAEDFWPGAMTLIFPRHPNLPAQLSPKPTIGVRIPDHPFVKNLLLEVGPLATTSANLSNGPNPSTAQDVMQQLGGRIELIVDGQTTPGTIGSTVIDCTGEEPVILRNGPISKTILAKYF